MVTEYLDGGHVFVNNKPYLGAEIKDIVRKSILVLQMLEHERIYLLNIKPKYFVYTSAEACRKPPHIKITNLSTALPRQANSSKNFNRSDRLYMALEVYLGYEACKLSNSHVYSLGLILLEMANNWGLDSEMYAEPDESFLIKRTRLITYQLKLVPDDSRKLNSRPATFNHA